MNATRIMHALSYLQWVFFAWMMGLMVNNVLFQPSDWISKTGTMLSLAGIGMGFNSLGDSTRLTSGEIRMLSDPRKVRKNMRMLYLIILFLMVSSLLFFLERFIFPKAGLPFKDGFTKLGYDTLVFLLGFLSLTKNYIERVAYVNEKEATGTKVIAGEKRITRYFHWLSQLQFLFLIWLIGLIIRFYLDPDLSNVFQNTGKILFIAGIMMGFMALTDPARMTTRDLIWLSNPKRFKVMKLILSSSVLLTFFLSILFLTVRFYNPHAKEEAINGLSKLGYDMLVFTLGFICLFKQYSEMADYAIKKKLKMEQQ